MAKFKVGDRARLVAVRMVRNDSPGWVVGASVRVIRCATGAHRNGLPYEYEVCADSGETGKVMGWQLEPLTPDLGSWEEIERLTKWKPQGVTA